MDPQILQPDNNQTQEPVVQAPMSPTPAPVSIEPSAPQQLFAPDVPLQAPKKPKGKKIMMILLVLLILGAVGAGAYYYFVMMKDSKDNTATQEPGPVTTEPVVETKKCLVASDYDSIYKEVSGTARPTDTTYGGEKDDYAQEVSFNPDSTDFAAPISTNEGVVTAFATFTKANESTKEFKITITGYYANDKQAEKDLATKRAEKVKELLVKKGASAELITVTEPKLVTNTTSPATDAAQTTAKTVKITIDAECKTTEQTTETTPATTPQQ